MKYEFICLSQRTQLMTHFNNLYQNQQKGKKKTLTRKNSTKFSESGHRVIPSFRARKFFSVAMTGNSRALIRRQYCSYAWIIRTHRGTHTEKKKPLSSRGRHDNGALEALTRAAASIFLKYNFASNLWQILSLDGWIIGLQNCSVVYFFSARKKKTETKAYENECCVSHREGRARKFLIAKINTMGQSRDNNDFAI